MYTDSHCHPENKRFDADRPDIFARAQEAGVTTMLAIGNGDGPGTGTFDCAIKLAEQYDGVYATVGIHPHEAALAKQEDFDELVGSRAHPKVIAWGEIGLDYFYDHSPRDMQQRVFVQQMELAKAAKLPIIIHCRPSDNSENAWDDLLRLVREHWAATGLGGVLHCFTGRLRMHGLRSISGSSFRLQVTLLTPRRRTYVMLPSMVPLGPCSSRPTHPTWRLFQTAASEMNRRLSSKWRERSGACGVSRRKRSGG